MRGCACVRDEKLARFFLKKYINCINLIKLFISEKKVSLNVSFLTCFNFVTMDHLALTEALIAEMMWGEKLVDRLVVEYRRLLEPDFPDDPQLNVLLKAFKQQKLQKLKACWSADTMDDLRRSEEHAARLNRLLNFLKQYNGEEYIQMLK